MRDSKYIDIHLHPHGRSYNYLRNSKLYDDFENYHAWTGIKSKYKHIEKGKRAFTYAQSSMAQCWNGNCAVVFAAIYPFEKGFFVGGGRLDGTLLNSLDENLDNPSRFQKFIGLLFAGNAYPIFNSDYGRVSVKDLFQSLLMGLSSKRIEYIQSPKYNYWKETLEEIKFLKNRDKIPTKSKLLNRKLKKEVNRPEDFEIAEGKYVLVKNYQELKSTVENKDLAVILTIEGMHALSPDTELGLLRERIEYLKFNLDGIRIFFITFAHHFNNNLCGHAHSLINSATLLTNQNHGLQGIFNPAGLAALRLVLSLDQFNQKDTTLYGQRILIDVKHMGAQSRKQFYQEVVIPCLELHGDTIPVIASHVCYSGIDSLDLQISNWKEGKESKKHSFTNNLNHWNINVSLEDIEIILRTEGLMGFCLDERIMGSSKSGQIKGKDLLKGNLERILLDLVKTDRIGDDQKSRIWKVLCIGTDFEGYIDPSQDYPTVMQFEIFEKDLAEIIQGFINSGFSQKFNISKSAEELARDICMNNVMEFLKKHY